MTIIEINNHPWQVLRRLAIFDRWMAARTWPDPWTADAWGGTFVCVPERILAALLTNPATRRMLEGTLSLDPDSEPGQLVGEAPNPDMLRRGEAVFSLTLENSDDGNRAVIGVPGLLRRWLGEETVTLPIANRAFGFDLVLGTIPLVAAATNIRWQAQPAGLALTCELHFSAAGQQEVLEPWSINWNRVGATLNLFPFVNGERLFWRHQLLVHLEPGGFIEAQIQDAVRAVFAEFFEEWGPLVMGALLSLPLRPVRDLPGFAQMEAEPAADLGLRLTNALYPQPPIQGIAAAFIDAGLLPGNPGRAIAVWIGSLAQEMGFFPARFADHFVRHVDQPVAIGRGRNTCARFDIEPIPNNGGARPDMTSFRYGHWAPTMATDDIRRDLGECVVQREQVRITLDHLTIPARSQGLVPPLGASWTLTWRARVRHRRLNNRRWTTLATWTTVPAVDNRIVTLGPSGVRFAWSEVDGDLEVVGELRANNAPVCWFSVARPMTPHGPQGVGASPFLASLPPRGDAGPPTGMEDHHRADAVVRVEQQTSLLRSMLEWLDLRVRHVHLVRPGALNAVSPFSPLFVELRVDGQVAARHRLADDEAGDVRGLQRVNVRGPSTQVYVDPTLDDARMDITVALLGINDEGTEITLTQAAVPLLREDPANPALRWGVHPDLGRGPVFVRSGDFQIRLDVTDRHYDPADVPDEDVVRHVRLFIQQIDVLEPTEFLGANLGEMYFNVTLASRLGNATLAEVGPVELGPFTLGTNTASPSSPVMIPYPLIAVYGGADGARLPLPEGAELRVFVEGEERAWWLPDVSLGRTTSSRTYQLDEPIDAVPPMNPLKESWPASSPSVPNGFFCFAVSAVGPPPPAPRFDPDGVPPFGDPPELRLPPGATLDFRYACVPWATSLVLQRRPRGEEDWVTLPTPALTVGVPGTASFVIPDAGRWHYRLLAENAAGERASRRISIRVVNG